MRSSPSSMTSRIPMLLVGSEHEILATATLPIARRGHAGLRRAVYAAGAATEGATATAGAVGAAYAAEKRFA
jgi:hypothetical protein